MQNSSLQDMKLVSSEVRNIVETLINEKYGDQNCKKIL